MTKSIEAQHLPTSDRENAIPQVFDKTSGDEWDIDPAKTASAMSEHYDISNRGIEVTSIVLDDKNRLSYRGSQTPKWLDRLIRGKKPENEGSGSVVRIGTKIRGRKRTSEDVNHTLSHELEHVAQSDRRDRNILLDNLAVWGLAGGGAFAGNKLGRRRKGTKIIGTIAGAAIGQALGYKLASHEQQARDKAAHTPLDVVTKRTP